MVHKQQLEISGMPYVPGLAKGLLQHGIASGCANRILIIRQQDIANLVEAPTGFIVIEGASFSHPMIQLMSKGIPAVIISEQQAKQLQEGSEVMIDGASGRIGAAIGNAKAPWNESRANFKQDIVTADGIPISLRASVRSQDAALKARLAGAKAIGLVRSEFLLPDDQRQPDSAFYTRIFREICEAAAPLPVTIRLLDVAADKIPTWMQGHEGVGGALGLQGVRLFGIEPMKSVCLAQLEAVNNLIDSYDIRILIPYLVRHEELMYWSKFIRGQLSKPLPLGAMVETPASALDLTNWFDQVDFVAIGCNDLMQCLFAADRDSAELRHYLDPYAPLLWRFMQQIAMAAETRLENIQLCGVLAQLPGVLPLLLGLGYRAFSVEAALIPYLRQIIATTRTNEARELVQQICSARESRDVLRILGLPFGGYQPFLSEQGQEA
jgi:phosphoenolpyruvate-protein kinase (PTS system EI component)